jgi:hypothetical protein
VHKFMLKIIIYMGLKDKPARIWIYPVSKQASYEARYVPHNFFMFPPFFLLFLFYAKKFIIIIILLLLLLLLFRENIVIMFLMNNHS